MKKLLIMGVLAVAACSGPTDPTPEGVVVFSEDFESGQVPDWDYFDCNVTIDSDKSYYLSMVSKDMEVSRFGFIHNNNRETAEYYEVSFKYRVSNTPCADIVFKFGPEFIKFVSCATGWNKQQISIPSIPWPDYYGMDLRNFNSHKDVALALDDIVITAYY